MPQMPAGYNKATFLFYDTLAGTQPADGFLTRSDMTFFFGFLDLNGESVSAQGSPSRLKTVG